jgi:hypothetical protein
MVEHIGEHSPLLKIYNCVVYFLQFVKLLFGFQFSVTEHYTTGGPGPRVIPGVFFFYDLSPIKVNVNASFKGNFDIILALALAVLMSWAVSQFSCLFR